MKHWGPNLTAVYAALFATGDVTEASTPQDIIGAAERKSGVHALPTDAPEDAATKWLTALGLPIPTPAIAPPVVMPAGDPPSVGQ
jgi:hypothetical protein